MCYKVLDEYDPRAETIRAFAHALVGKVRLQRLGMQSDNLVIAVAPQEQSRTRLPRQ